MDEAQDFPPTAHSFLCYVRMNVFADLPQSERPSLLILADENQQLTLRCSSIADIRSAYMLGPDDEYFLSQNYRNTREIAELARLFYVGLPTGVPELPERRGEKPKLVTTPDLNTAIDRIVTYCRLHPDHDVGVLVKYDRTRKTIFNKLSHRLKGSPVQTYSSQQSQEHPAEALRFDMGGSATVLCFASGKGLEFDAVFLPELQKMPIDSERLDQERMNLYVMVSRARTALFLMMSGETGGADIWNLIPRQSELLEAEG